MKQSWRSGYHNAMPTLRVAFDALPLARWGTLFHILMLERPGTRLQWLPREFPRDDRALLEHADVGLFVEPPPEPGLQTLTVATSTMATLMAPGHHLAHHHQLHITDILAEPFPDAPHLHPTWRAFWTLDRYRGTPPRTTQLDSGNIHSLITAISHGTTIATFPATLADGLPHPGVIWLPLTDGPPITTRLVWPTDDTNPITHTLTAITRNMLTTTNHHTKHPATAHG
jgi:DNA-binding transcriptional LysR family regulator